MNMLASSTANGAARSRRALEKEKAIMDTAPPSTNGIAELTIDSTTDFASVGRDPTIAPGSRASENSLRGSRGNTRIADASTAGWGDSAPLALAAFAVSAFMLSIVNANLVDPSVQEYVYGVALVYGGVTQFIAGLIQLRVGNTFTGVLFTSFGAFWMSLFVIVELFKSSVPPAHQGQALGLFLFAFGVFAAYMLLAAFRTNIVTIFALGALNVTLFLLAAGNFSSNRWLVHAGGFTGLVLAALATYLSASGVCQAAYGRNVLPVGDLSRP